MVRPPMIAPERYQTDGFVLRRYQPGDGALLGEALADSYDHLRQFLEWPQPSYPADALERNARRLAGRYLAEEDFTLAVLDPEETRLLGGTGFHLREGPREEGRAEIGMWIRADEAHRGLGTEILRATLRWGFTDWGFYRLSWVCSGQNIASQRCAEKAGMKLEGVLVGHRTELDGSVGDTHRYRLLRSEWEEVQRDGGGPT